MSSNPSSPTGPPPDAPPSDAPPLQPSPLQFPSAARTWETIQDAVLKVAEEQEPRLAAEVEAFALDEVGVPGVVEYVSQSDPEMALTSFRRANPDVDLSPSRLQQRAEKDPYSLAVGVLKAMHPDHNQSPPSRPTARAPQTPST